MLTRLFSALGINRLSADEARAVVELQAYTDRELADLGIARSDIVDLVRRGRPGYERNQAIAANDSRNDSRRAA
jgi:uncharacterized protein YjiS (DUF1127 family)